MPLQAEDVIQWLLKGDASIIWQVQSDLLESREDVYSKTRNLISKEGWGKKLLEHQDRSGLWVNGLYSPKWISTTYTLLLLRRMGLVPNTQTTIACKQLLDHGLKTDGGINYSKGNKSETCITGIVLAILSHFRYENTKIPLIIYYIMKNQLDDGGWNCRYPRAASHSSFHTTLSVLEGLRKYTKFKGSNKEIEGLRNEGHEFLLLHQMYKSHKTGKIANLKFTEITFPPRWHYNLLGGLDYLQSMNLPYDERLTDAIDLLLSKKKNRKWPKGKTISGKTWFTLEEPRKPSRWNTLRAMRVLNWWNSINYALFKN